MACDTAAEMWKRLETVYGRISEASVNTTMQKFYGSKYKSDGMAKHIAKFEDLAHQLNILRERVTDAMMVNKILSTLPSCNYFHAAWDSTQTKTLENLMSRLLLEEERLNAREKENAAEGSALTARGMNKGKGSSTNACFNCGKTGHWKKECRAKKSNDFEGQQKSKSKFCCKKRGHVK